MSGEKTDIMDKVRLVNNLIERNLKQNFDDDVCYTVHSKQEFLSRNEESLNDFTSQKNKISDIQITKVFPHQKEFVQTQEIPKVNENQILKQESFSRKEEQSLSDYISQKIIHTNEQSIKKQMIPSLNPFILTQATQEIPNPICETPQLNNKNQLICKVPQSPSGFQQQNASQNAQANSNDSINGLKKVLSQKIAELDEAKIEIFQLKQQLLKRPAEMTETTQLILILKKHNQDLEQELKQLKAELEDERKQKQDKGRESFKQNELEAKFQISQKELESLIEQEQRITQENMELTQKLNEAKKELLKIKSEDTSKRFASQLDKSQGLILELNTENNVLKTQLNKLYQEFQAKDAIMLQRENQILDLNNKYTESLELKDQRMQKELEKAIFEKEMIMEQALVKERKQKSDKMATLERENQDLKLKLVNAIEEIQRMNETIANLENSNIERARLIENLKGGRARINSQTNDHIKQLTEENQKLQKQIGQYLETHETNTINSDNQIKVMLQLNDALHIQLDKLAEQKIKIDETLKNKEKQIQILQDEMKQFKEKSEQKINELEKKLSEYQTELENLESQLTQEQEQHEKAISSLMVEKEEEIEQVKKKLSEVKVKQNSHNDSFGQIQRVDENIQYHIQNYEEEINSLTKKLKDQKQTIIGLRQRLAVYERQ